MAERRSLAASYVRDREWNSVIRIVALFAALLGLVMIAHEVLENVFCNTPTCSKIHLGTMLWGLTLLSFGLLIIQKGDVGASMRDFAATGTVIRNWWPLGRRGYDQAAPIAAILQSDNAPNDDSPQPLDT